MRAAIRKIGDTQSIVIPTALLAQLGLENEAELSVENDAIVIRKPRAAVRTGWADAARTLAESGDDALVWPEFANADDEALEW